MAQTKGDIGLSAGMDVDNGFGFGFYGRYLNYGASIGLNKFDEWGVPSNYHDYS